MRLLYHYLFTAAWIAFLVYSIYSGLFLAFLGTVLVIAELRAVLGFALIVIPLCIKLRLEEKWMHAQFGTAYQAYSQRVAALVPFVL